MARYDLRINGKAQTVESSDAAKPLLYVLRELKLTATKFGCGLGQCGACTVLIDGAPPDDRIDPILVFQSCGKRLEHHRARALATHIACCGCIEGPDPSVG